MCGIAGVLSPNANASHEELELNARRMVGRIRHRGPDSSGTWVDVRAGVALGHARLAILDLTPAGHQPMVSFDGRCVITFNGEIYNFRNIGRQLKAEGRQLRGQSDTEVLLEAISHWGTEATLAKCSGMFAFAAWFPLERKLVLARDRVGKKPLYYGWQNGTFYFGSELTALRGHPEFSAQVDPAAVELFLRYSCVPGEESVCSGIRKLGAGTYAVITAEHQRVENRRYWSAGDVVRDDQDEFCDLDDHAAEERLDHLIHQSVEQRLISDVPLGAFLSGGIDSTTVVSHMQRIAHGKTRTFTIGFEEQEFDEAPLAREFARHLGTEHTEVTLSARDALEVIPEIGTIYDEPFGDVSQIPTLLVSRLARRHVTVALSGDGGDELFCGYDRYQSAMKRWKKLSRWPHAVRSQVANMLSAGGTSTATRYAGLLRCRDAVDVFAHRHRRTHESRKLVPNANSLLSSYDDPAGRVLAHDPLLRMMLLDIQGWLTDDVLVKVDRASMSTALEVRNPLLDHRVIEFALRLPQRFKVRNGERKWLLKRVLERYVPAEMFNRPKRGFAVPVALWLRGPLRDWAEDLLAPQVVERHGLLSSKQVNKLWARFLGGSNKDRHLIWNVLMLQAWCEAHWNAGMESMVAGHELSPHFSQSPSNINLTESHS